jgi:hypothetical protein
MVVIAAAAVSGCRVRRLVPLAEPGPPVIRQLEQEVLVCGGVAQGKRLLVAAAGLFDNCGGCGIAAVGAAGVGLVGRGRISGGDDVRGVGAGAGVLEVVVLVVRGVLRHPVVGPELVERVLKHGQRDVVACTVFQLCTLKISHEMNVKRESDRKRVAPRTHRTLHKK